MSHASAATRFYAAMSDGDVAALRACLTPDAVVWHSFDGIAQDAGTAVAAIAALIAQSAERSCTDVREEPIAGGLLRRHTFVLEFATGSRKAWPVCMLFALKDGLIARIDEYIDRAGSFDPDRPGDSTQV